jgi:hypothetical protein
MKNQFSYTLASFFFSFFFFAIFLCRSPRVHTFYWVTKSLKCVMSDNKVLTFMLIEIVNFSYVVCYIKTKEKSVERIFQYLPQFKIYFSRTFRPCIITFRFVFNYTSIPLYSQTCIGPECEGINLISESQIGGIILAGI